MQNKRKTEKPAIAKSGEMCIVLSLKLGNKRTNEAI
jgi:hypothetical protein